MKRWLKSFEVKELLHISTGTLHNFRTNDTLPFTKIGGVVFYDMIAVEQILERHTTYQKVSK
nr:helix-turn-helix domain-containing protein [Mucilaginibacter sp.]